MFTTTPYMYARSNDMQLIQDIATAINGEYSAIICYEQLAKIAPDEEAGKQILEIRQDEVRHYQLFSGIYKALTGSPYTAQMSEPCPQSYADGLHASFKDEQVTTDAYLDIAEKAAHPYIQTVFRRAAADEQNHAVWFLYLITALNHADHSRQPVPSDYGAQGALQATTLTIPTMLTYALQDEYLAQSRYDAVLSAFGDVRTFVQIKEAERRHIAALLVLFQRYNVPIPPNNADSFVTTPESLKAAYAAGVQGEIDNIAMYDRFLTYSLPADMRTVFTRLRDASSNHLAAFERGAARLVKI